MSPSDPSSGDTASPDPDDSEAAARRRRRRTSLAVIAGGAVLFAGLQALVRWPTEPAPSGRSARTADRGTTADATPFAAAAGLPAVEGPALYHFFATWCLPCWREHREIVALAAATPVPIIGIAVQDEPAVVRTWLADLGDPYDRLVFDADGRRLGAAGLAGVPGLILVDGAGVVALRLTGPLTQAARTGQLAAAIAELPPS